MRRVTFGVLAIAVAFHVSAHAVAQKKGTIPGTPVAQSATPAGVLQYVPDDVVAVAAAQPARVINSKGFRSLIEATKGQDVLEEMLLEGLKQTGFKPEEVEEIAVILDLQTAQTLGETARNQALEIKGKNNLKQIGLAMHNFYDVNSSFPDEDGPPDDNKGNLSWRVHILPFLEESALYTQFNLDEPWDSAHNKTLIEKMPDVYASPGVEKAGWTSMHVLSGEGTPFGGDEPPTFQEIHDGTSNTIMSVMAGSDKMEVWTKPGGLEITADEPLASLGKIGERFLVLFMDGSVRYLPSDIDPLDLLHMMQHQDGFPLNYNGAAEAGPSFVPGFAVRCSTAIDQGAVMTKLFPNAEAGESIKFEGQMAKVFRGTLVVFPNPRMMLIGSETTLKAMLSKRAKSGDTKARFEELYPANDVAAVADLEPLQEFLPKLTGEIPMAGVLQSLRHVTLSTDVVGTGKSLQHVRAVMSNKQSAQQLTAMATGMYQMQKAQMLAEASRENSPITPEMAEILGTIMDSTVIKAEGTSVLMDMPKPADPDQFMKQLTPAFAELLKGVRAGRAAANRSRKLNALKQMGLAFHNYHDVYNGFPSFNAGRSDQGANTGLSWRVHLLPYFEEAALYQEFHLDEPWDSEHNKTLIERMPKLFACEGVDKPGHTAFHVFTGEDTPFGGEEPRGIQDILDGTSNTIMVVQAGPDTADVWTKPSGLEFNPMDPKKVLGNIGEEFMVLLCDGSTRFLSSKIADETLSQLIQHADGNVSSVY